MEDTGSAATTYTDDATEWETPYTYRIEAVNEHGTSERSRWVHVETSGPPALEGRTPARSAGQRQVQQRQTVVTLVSNVGEATAETTGSNDDRRRAQHFTTGSNQGGYSLSSVDVVSLDNQGDEFTVSVCTVTGGNPSSDCTDLTSPSSFAKGTLTFTAPDDTALAASTTYAVVITVVLPTGETSVPLAYLGVAQSGDEDAGAAAGWSIADDYQVDDSGWTTDASFQELLIAVKGSAVAGTETPETDETPANQVWSGTVTVAAIEAGSKVIAYGFLDTTGSLDDTGFTVDGTDYTIDGIFVGKQGQTTEGSLYFSLSSEATSAHKEALVLHAGGEEYVIADRNSEVAISFTYEWEDTDLDWESETSVTLRLTLQSVSEVSLQNDLAATTATIGRVLVGESARGTIGPTSGDVDWFAVNLEGDTAYRIDQEGSPTSKGTLTDPLIVGIYDDSGTAISSTENDNGGQGNNARLTFTPTATGTYYVAVGADGATGTYRVSVKEASDDATLSALSVLDNTTELVSSFAAGTYTYTASVDNSVTTVTVSATETDFGADVEITPEDSDTGTMGHQVSLDVGSNTITVTVTADDDSTQRYTVTVTRQEAQEEGSVTLVSNVGKSDSGSIDSPYGTAQEFTTGSNEDGYILSSVYVVSVDNQSDTFSASVCTAASDSLPSSTCTDLTAPGSFAKGTLSFTAPENIALAKDTDYFVLFTTDGDPTDDVVHFSTVTSNSEDAGAAAGWSIGNHHHYQNPMDVWAPTTTNASLRIAINGYAVVVVEAGFEEGDTDLAQDTSTIGVVDADGFASKGAVTESLDKDCFRVELEVGRTYQIVLWSALTGRDLTLGLPAINGLHDSDGGLLPNTYVDFTGEEDGHEHDGAGAVPVFGADAELVFTSLPGCTHTDTTDTDDVPECINIETTCTDDDDTCTTTWR